ncbi:hypothetical protein TRFO_23134 [Tritrichomonas foetus]|uniref:Macro domain-containing protein n=1 Tax=Tritrichomonas foetus TaxID=1144522 RepID=A0A1J4KB42_9EUKA|nr:hypothetical protein TRFO_23134 [Tritrichomonas foetus]|eukprot:OHT08435.1 hypothetical protein TRFO_23134 [Tritrichomonas foetus]
MVEKQLFSPGKWFEELFGFKESVKAVYENFTCEEKGDSNIITSKANGKSYNAGNFQVRSISSFKDLKPRGGGKLSVIVGNGRSTKNYKMIDVLMSEAQPENNGATYLAASNFNCLEFVGEFQTASMGVTGYVYDNTQGPYAALACGPAIVYRNYFVKVDDSHIGQIDKEIELLGDTPIPVINGYPSLKESFETDKKFSSFDWDNLDHYKVGVHRNCQVTTTETPNRKFYLHDNENHIVHQVYAAAFNFQGNCDLCKFTEKIGANLLKAEYMATVYAAWENSLLYPDRPGSNKLYLTLLGGGVFGNPENLILGAIAECCEVIEKSGLDVYIVCYCESSQTMRVIEEKLGKFIKKSGGSFINPDKMK